METIKKIPEQIDLGEVISLLNSGKAYSVFIDDTGFAGLDDKDITRYVAVIVKPDISPQILEIMQTGTDVLKREMGATEYHFKDIYQGRGEFEGITLNARLNIFRMMTSVFLKYIKPAIFVQSMDSETLAALAQIIPLPQLPSPISLNSPQGFAFLGVLTRVCSYIAQTRLGGEKAVIFCDEGILKSGNAFHIPFWPEIIDRNLVYFVNSREMPAIQLADFAAFVLNRQQYLAKKSKLNSLDKSFLFIVEPLASFFQNTEVEILDVEYDPKWHAAHIIRNMLSDSDKNILIVDERTGEIFGVGPDAEGKDFS